MDKLRALHYFVATAREGSFSAAARRLDVSVQAVAKLVNTLESDLEVALFDRTAQGMRLTAAGAGYLEDCGPALEQLLGAEERTRTTADRSKGTIVVGIQHAIAGACMTLALPRFHARYPDIEIDIRDFNGVADERVNGFDVVLVLGWPKADHLVHRRIGAGRFIVVAAPSYWAAHGIPARPADLERHVCLPIRAICGTIMDKWDFVRDGVAESALVGSWLTASNAHRDIVIKLALAGHGVVRIVDWMNLPEQRAGLLVQALPDWESTEAPPVNLLYRPSVRRIPRVRAFIDFATELFRELEAESGRRVEPSERPTWMRRRYGRISAAR